MKTLASRLNNRVAIHRVTITRGVFGDSREFAFFKNVWADIIPLTGKLNLSQVDDTQHTDIDFKIVMRKTDINQNDIILFKENTYEIDYIIPAFNKNDFIEVYAHLKKEHYGDIWWCFKRFRQIN